MFLVYLSGRRAGLVVGSLARVSAVRVDRTEFLAFLWLTGLRLVPLYAYVLE